MRLFILLIGVYLFGAVHTATYSRFLLNEGDLYVDKGRYLEAIDYYDSAYVASDSHIIKLDSIIRKANVLALFLNKPKIASNILYKEYLKYPNLKRSEYTLFYSAMLLKDYDIKLAKERFKEYLKKYPHGKFSFQAKYFVKRLKIKKKQKQIIIPKKVPDVRVLITKTKKAVFKGDLYINDNLYKNIALFIKNNKIHFNGNYYQSLKITSDKPIYLQNENKKYYGYFKIIPKKNKLYVINYIDMTHYLYGVVTSESYSKWHIEALKAQAVASRSFVYYQMNVRKNWLYDVRDDTFDQVYKGINGITKKAKIATDATKGEVLFFDKDIVLAQFTANSGWNSSSSKEIFGVDFEYLYSHKDKFSYTMPKGKWEKVISVRKLSENLKKMGLDFGEVIDIIPYKKVKSGRVIKVRIIGRKGDKILKTYSSIRRAARLDDILLKEIKKQNGKFVFIGGGYGHGVGYSQWGSEAMAKKGYSYQEILRFYYKNVFIKKLW